VNCEWFNLLDLQHKVLIFQRKWIAKAHADKLVTLTQNKACNVRVLSCHGVFHLHDMESNIILSFDDYKDREFELDTSNCTYCGKLCINPFLRKKGKRKR
jgi:hypothetical protein